MRTITRRRALKLLAFAGGGTWLLWKLAGRGAPRAVRRTRTLMGTTVNLTVVGPDREAGAAAADATLARMAALEARLSRHRPDSEVGRLNRHGVLASPSRALLDVLRLAERVHTLGDGAFDVTVEPAIEACRTGRGGTDDALALVGQDALHVAPGEIRCGRRGMALTLDGIGKGYIVDAGVGALKDRGFGNVLVEAGGDLVACGRRTPERRWTIGIRHPRRAGLLARVEAEDVAVATSGDYFQAFTADLSRHHIVDPRTGVSAPELASATVLAPTAAEADALATLAMVLGVRRTIELFEALPGRDACLVTKSSDIKRTSGFPPA